LFILADICIDFEDIEDDEEELKGDYFCPICSEEFDLVGLCCHIEEEHPLEAKSGVFILLIIFIIYYLFFFFV